MTIELVTRVGETSFVHAGEGYSPHVKNASLCEVTNTGNGYIIRFPATDCTRQDYYVCLDYAQAHDMILGFSAFKKELGFV